MDLELTNEEKAEILRDSHHQVQRRIYDLLISVEVRKGAGYTEEENKPLLTELERLAKVRDGLQAKLTELEDGH